MYVGLNRPSSKNNHFSICLVTKINYFVDYYLSFFCPSSFGNSHWKLTCSRHDIAENCWAGVKQQSLTHSSSHCVVCHFSIYEFWLPLWYLQSLPTNVPHIACILKYFLHTFEIFCCIRQTWNSVFLIFLSFFFLNNHYLQRLNFTLYNYGDILFSCLCVIKTTHIT